MHLSTVSRSKARADLFFGPKGRSHLPVPLEPLPRKEREDWGSYTARQLRFLATGLLKGLAAGLPDYVGGGRLAEGVSEPVVRLESWGSLDVDWVLFGFGGCGSTSLLRNLALHPEVLQRAKDYTIREDTVFA